MIEKASQNIDEALLKPLEGETEIQWIGRLVAGGVGRLDAVDIVIRYREIRKETEQSEKKTEAAKGYRRVLSKFGFGGTGPKHNDGSGNPNER